MARMDIALDLGTSYTSIFVSGNGIVLREPSVVAYYDNAKKTTRAVGRDAYAMRGKVPEKTKITAPIVDGAIKDPDACVAMLSEFIKHILPQSYIIKPKIRAVLGVPTGITVDERKMYEEVLMRSGIDEISMVNTVMLAGLGAELPVASTYGGFIVSIGGGVTEIAVLSLCGIVTGCSINIGGDMIDRTISDSIRGLYRIKIDSVTVRRVKEQIASLVRNDCAAMTVSGIDLETKNIKRATVSADKLYGAISVYYSNIIDAIESVINSCSPAVAAEIQNNGITVVGGGAKIPGLKAVMSDALGLRVSIPQDCEYAAVLGAGKLLSDRDLMDDILRHA